MIIKKLDMRFG